MNACPRTARISSNNLIFVHWYGCTKGELWLSMEFNVESRYAQVSNRK